MTRNSNQVTGETSRSRGPIPFSLLVVDFVLFASGAVAHITGISPNSPQAGKIGEIPVLIFLPCHKTQYNLVLPLD
jgi:hypothetical protein